MSGSRVPASQNAPRNNEWEVAGLELGESLDAVHLVLVLGQDAGETAYAALGVARAQAAKRRVALGDLFGDAEPIADLLDTDDPHGLVDSFLYGVSLNKIAHPVPQLGELYVLPSGSEVSTYEEIFTNPRWRRLATGFRETGALLVVAAPIGASRVADVQDIGDGAILVGDAELPHAVPERLLGRVRPDSVAPAPAIERADEPIEHTVEVIEPVNEPIERSDEVIERSDERVGSAEEARGKPEKQLEQVEDGIETEPLAAEPPWWRRRPVSPTAIGGIALAALLAVVGVWLAVRPLARGHEPLWLRQRRTSTAAGAVPSTIDTTVRLDSSAADSTDAPRLVLANAADSANAAPYAVALMTMNTQAGAIWWLQTSGRTLPAATFSPVLVQGAPWFRVLVGAYRGRAQADSLLAVLRSRGDLRAGVGDVIRAPFAFLVDSVKPEAVTGLVKYFADRGQPVYALQQTDGSARLYAGAFETPEQAAMFVTSIRASGIRPVLVYRTGRVN